LDHEGNASVTAAFDGYAEMAISNSIGGIAAQSAIMGLLRHEKLGIANIGFKSFAILVLYGIVVLKLVFFWKYR
jgi:hypothetical protein